MYQQDIKYINRIFILEAKVLAQHKKYKAGYELDVMQDMSTDMLSRIVKRAR